MIVSKDYVKELEGLRSENLDLKEKIKLYERMVSELGQTIESMQDNRARCTLCTLQKLHEIWKGEDES